MARKEWAVFATRGSVEKKSTWLSDVMLMKLGLFDWQNKSNQRKSCRAGVVGVV